MILRHASLRKSLAAAITSAALVATVLLAAVPASAASRIPVGTKFNLTLTSQDINTKNAQPGDPLTMTVVPPYPNGNAKYAGATVYGHIASVRSAGQGRTAQMTFAFDKIVLGDGSGGPISGTMIRASTVSENTTARKALGAGAGMAVGSQTIGRIIGGSAGAVVGMLGGAAGGYAYASNQKANFNLAKGASATMETTEPTLIRPQAR